MFTRVDGGGQLARVAAYIRERSTRCSPAFDEFVCRTPKVPPDRMTAQSESLRHIPNVASEKEKGNASSRSHRSMHNGGIEVAPSQSKALRAIPKHAEPECDTGDIRVRERYSEQPVEAVKADRHSLERLIEAGEVPEELPKPALIEGKRPYIPKRQYTPSAVSKREASAYPHSHITSAALTLPVILPAFLSQANSINQPSSGLDWLLLKPPDGVGFEWCLHDTVSLNPLPSVVRHSPKHQVARRPPIPKPGRPWAYPRRSQNVECWWRARCKPPSVAVTTKRRSDCIVSMIINLSASEHLPSSEAASVLPIPSSACSSQIRNPRYPSLKRVARILKPPNRVAYNRLLYEAVTTLNKRADSVTYLGWNATTPRRSLCSSPLLPLLRIAGRGRWMLRRPRLLVAVFGQRN